jgi:hypothetical protein
MTNSEESQSQPKTPLEEAQAAGELIPTLKELFDKDPLDLTKDDRFRLCEAMRARREIWMAEEARATSAGKNPAWKTKGTSKIEDLVDKLQIGSLGELDLSSLED